MPTSFARRIAALAVAACALAPQRAPAQSFVLDPASASLAAIPASAADVLNAAVAPAPGPLPLPLVAETAAAMHLLPGDVITRMEGLSVGFDGTLRDYCDVLRSRDPGDPIAIQVLRYDTGEILQGELNGDELEVTDLLSDEISDEVDLGDGSGYAVYVFVEDDSGVVSVEVPESWSDLDGTPFVLEANANPNLEREEDFAYAALHDGIGYPELLKRIIALGRGYRAKWRETGAGS